MADRITRTQWLTALLVMAATFAILVGMDRPLICTCGTIKLWEGEVFGPGNSQHITDWYSFSHMEHGFLFFGAAWLWLRHWPLGWRLVAAMIAEMAWEIAENSPVVIDRYRSATAAFGYSGDSILNSMFDGVTMATGFLIASRLPWKVTLAIGIAFELFTLAMVRDNLTLNVLMLVWPIDAIKVWQGVA